GSAEKSIIGEPEPVLTGLPTGVPGCAGSPSWQVFPRGQVTPRGSENVVALKTTARRASIWCCAKTRAVPSLRLFEFISTDVGTSCATATSPTRMITVATTSSIKVKPDCPPLVVPRFVNTRLILSRLTAVVANSRSHLRSTTRWTLPALAAPLGIQPPERECYPGTAY